MKILRVAALSLTLASVLVAGQSYAAAEDDDSIVPLTTPKKVDMRPGQVGNLPLQAGQKAMVGAGKYLPSNRNTNSNTVQTGTIAVDQPGEQKVGKYLPSNKNVNNNVQGGAVVVDQSAQKVGKFLPSNRKANGETAQLPGVPVEELVENAGKKNHKTINQRSSEFMGESF